MPIELSTPQLVAVSDRLTLALEAPKQKSLGGESDVLATDGLNALPALAGGEGNRVE